MRTASVLVVGLPLVLVLAGCGADVEREEAGAAADAFAADVGGGPRGRARSWRPAP